MGERREQFPDTHLAGDVLVVGSTRCDTGSELAKILARLEGSAFKVQPRPRATFDDVLDGLETYEPCIVHFMGHFEEDTGRYVFKARNDPHAIITIDEEVLAKWFKRRKDIKNAVQCVVLNGCSSLKLAESIRPHVEYVIGMRDVISDQTAEHFADEFYRHLVEGESQKLGYAFDRARESIEGSSRSSTGEDNPVLLPNPDRQRERAAPAAIVVVEPTKPSWRSLAILLAVNALLISTGSWWTSRRVAEFQLNEPSVELGVETGPPELGPSPPTEPPTTWFRPALALVSERLVEYGLRELADRWSSKLRTKLRRQPARHQRMVCQLTRIVGEDPLKWPQKGPLCASISAYIAQLEVEGITNCQYRNPNLDLIAVSKIKPAFSGTDIYAVKKSCSGLTLEQITEKTP